ncbi:hypothetical protein Tco_0877366 [Tanacetum coccineum]|uniref:Uncharacterized protein n=1 Tax=Tanacetum coccineum TaxID=301880 RepID=A0ABQ5BUW8_9ASTR
MAEQDIPPPTITAMKIPIIRKGEYDIWSMRMRQYICHTDHNLWDVIVNGDLEEEPAPTGETSAPPAPKTAKQLAAKRNQERVKSILLLAIPDEYLLKFHNVADAKSLWEAIKSRFGGNEESKKMQKNVLKHQFENFSTASNESLDKAYDRFQKLISQLEVHGAPISKEDINQKFLRSLPPSWNQIALIMRNKPDIDEIDIDDLYNNLRVYEDEMKRSSSSTSTSQNLAFLSSENTSSTNEVSTASGDFRVSTAGSFLLCLLGYGLVVQEEVYDGCYEKTDLPIPVIACADPSRVLISLPIPLSPSCTVAQHRPRNSTHTSVDKVTDVSLSLSRYSEDFRRCVSREIVNISDLCLVPTSLTGSLIPIGKDSCDSSLFIEYIRADIYRDVALKRVNKVDNRGSRNRASERLRFESYGK